VGNHSYGHDLGASLEETRQAVAESQRVFLEQAGIDSRPVFRAPAYTRTEWMDDVLLELGYTENLEATLDPHDWANPPPPARAIAMCVAAETLPGDILLFHVGPANTAEALSEILRSLSARGYRFVTVEELLQFGEPALAGMSRQCGKYYGRLEVVP
jgi:peptidoglycan/xylan/chitin deacetylase (PgdA/CDA1 family)